ncbi:MAG TPA: flagellar biosynthetic protein FliR [Ramlibacter sp.]|nr:flagellar biosynthetic protein FliR [Ramlibacter sp.]
MPDLLAVLGIAWVATVALVAARIGALLLVSPLFRAIPVPAPARVVLTIGLSVALAMPMASVPVGSLPPGDLFTGLGRELALGATMGLGVLAAFAGLSFAGRVLDLQIGFGFGQVLDPVTRQQVPVLTTVFGVLGVLLFLLVDGHHGLLRALALSVDRFPPGQPWPVEQAIAGVVRQVAGLFALGFALAAPVVLCLFLLDVALGVLARNLPQMNMLALGIPAKVVVGLLALSLWAGGMGGAVVRLHAHAFDAWAGLFAPPAAAPGARR